MSEWSGHERRRWNSAGQRLIGMVGSVVLAGFVLAAPSRTQATSREASVPDRQADAAVTSTWLRDKVHPELIDERVKAFGEVRPNLVKHAPGYPTETYLKARVASGLPVYGLAGVGEGKDSAASELLIAAVDRVD